MAAPAIFILGAIAKGNLGNWGESRGEAPIVGLGASSPSSWSNLQTFRLQKQSKFWKFRTIYPVFLTRLFGGGA